MIPVPVLTPELSALWLRFVSGAPRTVAEDRGGLFLFQQHDHHRGAFGVGQQGVRNRDHGAVSAGIPSI